jgi:hemin uptake protein HemP
MERGRETSMALRRRATAGVAEPLQSVAPEVPVEAILGAGREAVIIHNGVRYRLRVTSNDKLILTK